MRIKLFLALALLMASMGTGLAFATSHSAVTPTDCCAAGLPCCDPPSTCCAAVTAPKTDCCSEGKSCCEIVLPCCAGTAGK